MRHRECNCLESCNSKSYGLDVTYASLMALSVNTFLDSKFDDLQGKYHRALELKYVSLFIIISSVAYIHWRHYILYPIARRVTQINTENRKSKQGN